MNRTRRIFWLALSAVFLLTVWVQLPATRNGFVNWDDPVYLAEISRLGGLTWRGIWWSFTALTPYYYHPVAWLSHLLDFSLWGWHAAGHHLMSVLIHALNAVLVTALAALIGRCGGLTKPRSLVLGVGVGAAFGLHPLQVESVAWFAERKNLLCGFFLLAGLIAYVQHRRRAATGLFVVALLAKPMAMTVPVVLLLTDYWPLRRRHKTAWRQLVVEKWLLWVACALTGVQTVWSQHAAGAVTGLGQFSLLERYVVAARNLIFYPWKLLWPVWLSPYYPLEGRIPITDLEFLLPAVAVPATVVAIIWLGRQWPILLWSIGGYLALILPVSGLFQAGGQSVADRFAYVALVPLLLLVGFVMVGNSSRLGVAGQVALATLAAVWLALLGISSRAQIPVWRDDERLWSAAYRYFPSSVKVNWQMAAALAAQDRHGEAVPYAERAVMLNPRHTPIRLTLARVYLRAGRAAESVTILDTLMPLPANQTDAQFDRACALVVVGRLAEAMAQLESLVAAAPGYAALAGNEPMLAPLRDHPEYTARFRRLLQPAAPGSEVASPAAAGV